MELLWTYKCLAVFNFGSKFRKWIHIIFKSAKTSILTNGFRSRYFKISRSVRQGCPVSPLLSHPNRWHVLYAILLNNQLPNIPQVQSVCSKTTGLYTGPWKNKTPEFNEIKWTEIHVKTLGIVNG